MQESRGSHERSTPLPYLPRKVLTKVLSNMQLDVLRWSCPQVTCRKSLKLCGRTRGADFRRGGRGQLNSRAGVCKLIEVRTLGFSGFCPHGPTMHLILLRQRCHADAVCAGCSHSVHFLIRKPCSRSSPWLCRRANERVILCTIGLGTLVEVLIPRGCQPLQLSSPVPAVLNQAHHTKPESAPASTRVLRF